MQCKRENARGATQPDVVGSVSIYKSVSYLHSWPAVPSLAQRVSARGRKNVDESLTSGVPALAHAAGNIGRIVTTSSRSRYFALSASAMSLYFASFKRPLPARFQSLANRRKQPWSGRGEHFALARLVRIRSMPGTIRRYCFLQMQHGVIARLTLVVVPMRELPPTRLNRCEKIDEQISQPLLGSMERTRIAPG